MSRRHPRLELILSSTDREVIDADALDHLIDELGAQRGPDSLPHLRDLVVALSRIRIDLISKPNDAPRATRAIERGQRIFVTLLKIGVAHDQDDAALILHEALPLVLRFYKYEHQDHHASFDRARCEASEPGLFDAFEGRIIASASLDPDERLRAAIEAFPVGASYLRALVAQSEHLHLHAEALGRLFFAHAGHPALDRELLETFWRHTPVAVRCQLLNELASHRDALDVARRDGWSLLFVACADTDPQRALLLKMRNVLHEPRWSEIACQLLPSPNPALRAIALDTLEESASRAALPALASARVNADRAERRRIDAIIAGIHQREPMPGDADGSLSISEVSGGAGMLSLAQDAPGGLSLSEAGALAPARADGAVAAVSPRAQLLERWSPVAPGEPSAAVWFTLVALGATGRRAALWLALTGHFMLAIYGVISPNMLVVSAGLIGLAALIWSLLDDYSDAIYLRAIRGAPAALATVEQVAHGQTHLRLADGTTRQVSGMPPLEVGDRAPVWRLVDGERVSIVPLERCGALRVDAGGVVCARPRYTLVAALLVAATLASALWFCMITLMIT
jgi:hypothetical protein